jgi:uncharacterized cupin superfamily protein
MRKVNINQIAEDSWVSPKGRFAAFGKSVSIALGRKDGSTDLRDRHPFDLEILRVAPGQTPYPYHSHSAQWELYHVIAGSGCLRHKDGTTPIEKGDAFIFPPDEPHVMTNDGSEDLVMLVIADNPIGESGYYPDSKKWLVRSPKRTIIRPESPDGEDYFLGEE